MINKNKDFIVGIYKDPSIFLRYVPIHQLCVEIAHEACCSSF